MKKFVDSEIMRNFASATDESYAVLFQNPFPSSTARDFLF